VEAATVVELLFASRLAQANQVCDGILAGTIPVLV